MDDFLKFINTGYESLFVMFLKTLGSEDDAKIVDEMSEACNKHGVSFVAFWKVITELNSKQKNNK